MVRSGESLTVRLPAGYYKIYQGTGTCWYGNNYGFGPNGRYTQFDTVLHTQPNYYYSMTLYSVEGGTVGQNTIDYDEVN
jgi:hypothetical protein